MPAMLLMLAGYVISSLIARLLLGAGLSVVTFYFITDLVDQAKNAIQGAFLNLPADAIAFIQLYKIDQGISIILSALAIAAYVKTAKVFVGRA